MLWTWCTLKMVAYAVCMNVRPRPREQQCRSNIRHCRKNRSTCSIRQCCLDIVADMDGAVTWWLILVIFMVSPPTVSAKSYDGSGRIIRKFSGGLMAIAERKPIMGVWGRAWTKGASPPPPRNSSTVWWLIHSWSAPVPYGQSKRRWRANAQQLQGQRSRPLTGRLFVQSEIGSLTLSDGQQEALSAKPRRCWVARRACERAS